MFKFLKYTVSQGRNRYVDDKYDLDLSYITPRVVAMGLPSSGMSSMWRNDIDEVSSFLHEKHSGDYMIWNWLNANEKHIAVVHCKAGKGRTGTVICSYLLFEKICKTPEEALEYFKKMRSGEKQTSVDEPSQVRYIGYFHEFLNGKKVEPVKMHLKECVIQKIGEIYAEAPLTLEVYYFEGKEDNNHEKVLILKKDKYKLYQDGTIVFDIELDVEGDVVIDCTVQWTLSVETVFRYSFHTAFITEPTIKCLKDDLDETYKKSDSIFSSVEFKFKL